MVWKLQIKVCNWRFRSFRCFVSLIFLRDKKFALHFYKAPYSVPVFQAGFSKRKSLPAVKACTVEATRNQFSFTRKNQFDHIVTFPIQMEQNHLDKSLKKWKQIFRRNRRKFMNFIQVRFAYQKTKLQSFFFSLIKMCVFCVFFFKL